MVIDNTQLIALLVEKTGRSREEVEEQFRQLKKQIEETVAAGEIFEIPQFGVFSKKEGTLQFEPAEQLKTEINQKYAGMKPLELMEAFKELGAGIPVEAEPKSETPEEPAAADSEVSLPAKEENPQPKEEAEEPQKESAPVAKSPEKKSKRKKEPAKKPKSTHKEMPVSDRRRGGNGSAKVFIIAAVVLIVLAGGWLLYANGVFRASAGDQQNSTPADTTNQQLIPRARTIDSLAQSKSDSTEQSAAAPVSTDSTKQSNTVSSKYGLKGRTNQQLENVFTIVIHSFHLKSTVQEIADSLNNENYRTIIFQGSVDEGTRWRLGIGQFESIEQAQTVADTLPEPYRDDHFITRINS